MAEAQQAPSSPAPTAAPAATPTEPQGLEKVYRDFNVEGEAASFKPETPAPQAPTPQPQAPAIPDPFSPGFQDYQRQIAQGQTVLHQRTTEAIGRLTNLEQRIQQREVAADIKQAASTIAEKSGIDHDYAEVALEVRARKDPKFLQIWKNRSQNPKAFNAAVEALSGEIKDKFSVKQDPQLVENQRAVRASQQQMATTTKESDQDKWANMSPTERAQERQRIMRGR